jgi:hypothetical protein
MNPRYNKCSIHKEIAGFNFKALKKHGDEKLDQCMYC